MAEVKLRYNPEAEEVELVVDDEVALSTGAEVFESWVDAHNENHPEKFAEPEPTEEEVLRKEVEDLKNKLAAAEAAAVPPSSDAPVEEQTDTTQELDTESQD